MNAADLDRRRRLGRFAWGVVAYNLLVIAWGAFVRATGSGAGCGRHWPLCNGEIVPTPKSVATIIEASHRVTSGLALVLVIALAVRCFTSLAKGDRARRFAALSAVFIVGEAVIGAGLVLFELVAHDASMKRALSSILHLGNTFLLLASLAVTAWSLSRDDAPAPVAARGKDGRLLGAALAVTLGAVLLLAASGAVAALGDTLFPARTLREGLANDVSPVAHAFVRLRMLHPVIALGTSILVLSTAAFVRMARPGSGHAKSLSRTASLLVVVQFAAGLVNVVLLAPVAMQIVHLLLADATWIALVLMTWEALWGEPEVRPQGGRRPEGPITAQAPIKSRNGPAPTSDVPPSTSNVEPVTYAPAGDTR